MALLAISYLRTYRDVDGCQLEQISQGTLKEGPRCLSAVAQEAGFPKQTGEPQVRRLRLHPGSLEIV